MLGSIEELEKEIEQFQNNMMASGEMVTSLKQMLEQIKNQNESFEQKSSALISRIDALPTAIDNANSASNSRIKADVSNELGQAVQSFTNEQNRYLQGLEQTYKAIKSAEGKLEVSYEGFLSTLEKTNIANLYEQNQQLKEALNKRTTILMVISAVSIVIGIVGLFI